MKRQYLGKDVFDEKRISILSEWTGDSEAG